MERIITSSLDIDGFPFITVGCGRPNSEIYQFTVKAIIDTGAAYCLMQPPLIEKLGLTAFKHSKINHPVKGELLSSNYMTSLYIDLENPIGCAKVEGLRVGILHELSYPAGMIIGCEFLQYCRFNYDGPNKTFELCMKF
ncbi:MAG: hypothetical protein WCF67_20365 [Chitinophagaceae bacterium]